MDIAIEWRLEDSPAAPRTPSTEYFDAVRETDLFILFLGNDIAKPVLEEYYLARLSGKPVLAFLIEDKAPDRTDRQQTFTTDLGRDIRYQKCAVDANVEDWTGWRVMCREQARK